MSGRFYYHRAAAFLAAVFLFLSTQTAGALWNGRQLPNRSSSFTALLKISGKRQLDCSGVMIAPRLVLTAGHCLHGARQVSVRIGSEVSEAETWLVNPSWSAGLPANGWDARINASNSDRYIDLAVVLLRRMPRQARSIAITEGDAPSEQAALRTYGYARGKTLEPLYKVDIADASFLRRLSPQGPFKFYASSGAAWCQGDSGGPVTRIENGTEKLVGIVGLGLGAIDHDSTSVVAMRWGGSARVPKCGSYAYVQDVRLHAGWIEQAQAALTGEAPFTSSIPNARSAAYSDDRQPPREIR